MKRLLLVVTGVCVAVCMSFGQHEDGPAPNADLVISAVYYSPGQDDDYDSGFGGELQMRFWASPNAAIVFSGGAAAWQMNEDEVDPGVVTAVDGDVNIFPVGGSILLRPISGENMSLTLEAGVRYVFVDSQADVEVFDGSGYDTKRLEIDDGVVGLVAAEIVTRFGSQLSLLLSAGYQFDLSKGDATWFGADAGENELKAFLAKAGFVMEF